MCQVAAWHFTDAAAFPPAHGAGGADSAGDSVGVGGFEDDSGESAGSAGEGVPYGVPGDPALRPAHALAAGGAHPAAEPVGEVSSVLLGVGGPEAGEVGSDDDSLEAGEDARAWLGLPEQGDEDSDSGFSAAVGERAAAAAAGTGAGAGAGAGSEGEHDPGALAHEAKDGDGDGDDFVVDSDSKAVEPAPGAGAGGGGLGADGTGARGDFSFWMDVDALDQQRVKHVLSIPGMPPPSADPAAYTTEQRAFVRCIGLAQLQERKNVTNDAMTAFMDLLRTGAWLGPGDAAMSAMPKDMPGVMKRIDSSRATEPDPCPLLRGSATCCTNLKAASSPVRYSEVPFVCRDGMHAVADILLTPGLHESDVPSVSDEEPTEYGETNTGETARAVHAFIQGKEPGPPPEYDRRGMSIDFFVDATTLTGKGSQVEGTPASITIGSLRAKTRRQWDMMRLLGLKPRAPSVPGLACTKERAREWNRGLLNCFLGVALGALADHVLDPIAITLSGKKIAFYPYLGLNIGDQQGNAVTCGLKQTVCIPECLHNYSFARGVLPSAPRPRPMMAHKQRVQYSQHLAMNATLAKRVDAEQACGFKMQGLSLVRMVALEQAAQLPDGMGDLYSASPNDELHTLKSQGVLTLAMGAFFAEVKLRYKGHKGAPGERWLKQATAACYFTSGLHTASGFRDGVDDVAHWSAADVASIFSVVAAAAAVDANLIPEPRRWVVADALAAVWRFYALIYREKIPKADAVAGGPIDQAAMRVYRALRRAWPQAWANSWCRRVKLHCLQHFSAWIRLHGSPLGWSTQVWEGFHRYCKRLYARSNHRDPTNSLLIMSKTIEHVHLLARVALNDAVVIARDVQESHWQFNRQGVASLHQREEVRRLFRRDLGYEHGLWSESHWGQLHDGLAAEAAHSEGEGVHSDAPFATAQIDAGRVRMRDARVDCLLRNGGIEWAPRTNTHAFPGSVIGFRARCLGVPTPAQLSPAAPLPAAAPGAGGAAGPAGGSGGAPAAQLPAVNAGVDEDGLGYAMLLATVRVRAPTAFVPGPNRRPPGRARADCTWDGYRWAPLTNPNAEAHLGLRVVQPAAPAPEEEEGSDSHSEEGGGDAAGPGAPDAPPREMILGIVRDLYRLTAVEVGLDRPAAGAPVAPAPADVEAAVAAAEAAAAVAAAAERGAGVEDAEAAAAGGDDEDDEAGGAGGGGKGEEEEEEEVVEEDLGEDDDADVDAVTGLPRGTPAIMRMGGLNIVDLGAVVCVRRHKPAPCPARSPGPGQGFAPALHYQLALPDLEGPP